MAETTIHESMMKMCPIWREWTSALKNSHRHHPKRIKNRNAKDTNSVGYRTKTSRQSSLYAIERDQNTGYRLYKDQRKDR